MSGTNVIKNRKIDQLEECFQLGVYQLFVMIFSEFAIIGMLTNMVFMMFGGARPRIVSCDDYQFNDTALKTKEICNQINYLRNASTNSSCNIEVKGEFQSINAEWNLLCDNHYQINQVVSYQMIGVVFGSLLFGQLSDMFGRKPTIQLSMLGLILCGIGSSFSPSFGIFTIFRIAIGFFNGGVITSVNVYVIEYLPKRHRLWINTIVCWAPNFVIFSIVAYLSGDWRTLARVVNLLAVPALIIITFLSESPRWLIQHNRSVEAIAALKSMTSWNRTLINLDQLKDIVQMEVDKMNINATKQRRQRYYFYHLFYSSTLCKYTVITAFILFSTSCISYSLLFNMDKISGSLYINCAFGGILRIVVGGLVGIVDYNAKCVGRKVMHFASVMIVVVSVGTIAAIYTVYDVDLLPSFYRRIIQIMTLSAFSITGSLFLQNMLVSAELYPTVIRNLANAHSSTWSRFGAVVGPALFNLTYPVPYMALFVIALLDALAFQFFLPETKSKPLPENMPSENEAISACCRNRKQHHRSTDKFDESIKKKDTDETSQRSDSFIVYKFKKLQPVSDTSDKTTNIPLPI